MAEIMVSCPWQVRDSKYDSQRNHPLRPWTAAMSEYQYYEFQAIDKPLDERAMVALRTITSRAEITPTSLVNVYHFGDFKGNPDRLMDQYFDAFLYVANWGTHRLMLRLPKRVFNLAAAKPYCMPNVLQARATKEHVVLDFCSQEEEGNWEEGEPWMASLIPLRSDLLAGDLRCLYLGWLAAVESGEVDENCIEPPVPAGLSNLSVPLKRFADFLRVDTDLIEIAALASLGSAPLGPSPNELAAWVAALPSAEKDGLLIRVIQGESPHLRNELLRQFWQDRTRVAVRSNENQSTGSERRTVARLLEARDAHAEDKRRQAAERTAKEQARHAREEAVARAHYLDSLAGREAELWREAETAISTKQAKEYDRAVSLIKDLRDRGEHSGTAEVVTKNIRKLRQRHSSKWSLIRKLDQAGLPK